MSTRNHRRTMSVFYAAFGRGPWMCTLCDQEILRMGRKPTDGNVHHEDGDKTNDDLGNLKLLHGLCHQRLHHAGKTHTQEHNAKVGRKGRVFTPEWRAKLSSRQRTRVKCPECSYTHSPQYVGRHRKAVGH